MASPLAGLTHLTKAPNKAAVLRAFNRVFIHRHDAPSARALPLFTQDFGLSEAEAHELFQALLAVIEPALYTGEVSPGQAEGFSAG
jgi:hypothetical protein